MPPERSETTPARHDIMRTAIIATAVAIVATATTAHFYRHRQAAELEREAAIRTCLGFPLVDRASCESSVDAGSIEARVQIAAHTQLTAMQQDVVAARKECKDLDAAIGYVELGRRVRSGEIAPQEASNSTRLLEQGFECERLATKAALEFADTQHALAEAQRAAGFQVTVHDVTLPDADTPQGEAWYRATESPQTR